MTEGRVPEVVPEPDRLGQVLVEAQGASDGAGDPASLQRVGEPGPVVVSLGGDEDLRLVLQSPERRRVDDPVPVPLKRRPQRTVRLLHLPPRRIGPRRLGRKKLLLPSGDPVLKGSGHRHSSIISGADLTPISRNRKRPRYRRFVAVSSNQPYPQPLSLGGTGTPLTEAQGPRSESRSPPQLRDGLRERGTRPSLQLSGGAKLHVRVVLERLPHGPLDLAQRPQLGLGSLAERLRQALDHEPMRLLAEREGTRFAAAADDSPGGAGEAGQVLGLAAAGAGGELGGEAGGQRQLQPEGKCRLELRGAGLVGVVEQRQVAAEEVVAVRVRPAVGEQAQDRVAAAGAGGEGGA